MQHLRVYGGENGLLGAVDYVSVFLCKADIEASTRSNSPSCFSKKLRHKFISMVRTLDGAVRIPPHHQAESPDFPSL